MRFCLSDEWLRCVTPPGVATSHKTAMFQFHSWKTFIKTQEYTKMRSLSIVFLSKQNFSVGLKRLQVNETRVFPRIDYALITEKTQVIIHFVQYLNFNDIFINWSAWSSTVIKADETLSNLISLPHHHTISYNNNREAWAFVHKIRNQGVGPCLRALKERQKRGRAKTGQAKFCYLISLWK